MTSSRPSGLRIWALVAATLIGIAWAAFDGMFVLALRGDCEGELAWMRQLAYDRLVTPDDGVELIGTAGAEQLRPDGTPWFRVARPIAECFPDRLKGNQLELPAGQWPEDFIESVTWRMYSIHSRTPGQHPDATWPYPFNSEAGECVHSKLLGLRAQADTSVPDSYCGISWWLPPLRTWLVEGLLPALGLFAAAWFLVARRKRTGPET